MRKMTPEEEEEEEEDISIITLPEIKPQKGLKSTTKAPGSSVEH